MKIVVIEDDFMFREKIVNVIEEIYFDGLEIEVVSKERFFFKNLDSLKIADSTLFLIDIELKNYFNGIDIAEKIRKRNKNCFIAFITAYEKYGLEVINRQIFPIGYLSKQMPMKQLNLRMKDLVRECLDVNQYRDSKDVKITVDLGGQKVIIPEKDIIYIATVPGYKKMLRIKHTEGELLTKGRIKLFREQLRTPYFFKELKSFIVNINRIEKLYLAEGTVQFKGQLILDIGITGTRKINHYLKGKMRDES